jgi:hypothetical protein
VHPLQCGPSSPYPTAVCTHVVVVRSGCATASELGCGASAQAQHVTQLHHVCVCVCVCACRAAQATYFERQEKASKQHLLREEVDKYLGPQVDTLKDFSEVDALELLLECVEDKHGVVLSDLYEFLGTLRPGDAGASVASLLRISLRLDPLGRRPPRQTPALGDFGSKGGAVLAAGLAVGVGCWALRRQRRRCTVCGVASQR